MLSHFYSKLDCCLRFRLRFDPRNGLLECLVIWFESNRFTWSIDWRRALSWGALSLRDLVGEGVFSSPYTETSLPVISLSRSSKASSFISRGNYNFASGSGFFFFFLIVDFFGGLSDIVGGMPSELDMALKFVCSSAFFAATLSLPTK